MRQRSAHSNTHPGAIAQKGVRLTARSSAVARPKGESEWTAQCACARASMLTLKSCRRSARTRLARFAPSPARPSCADLRAPAALPRGRPPALFDCVAGAAPGGQALRGSGGPTFGGRRRAAVCGRAEPRLDAPTDTRDARPSAREDRARDSICPQIESLMHGRPMSVRPIPAEPEPQAKRPRSAREAQRVSRPRPH